MLKRVLVAVDGSEHSKRALEFACDLAHKYDARLYLLHVALRPRADLTLVVGDTTLAADASNEEIEEAGRKVIEAAKEIAHQNGCKKLKANVAAGPTAQLIVDSAKKNKVDMIVMGSRGLSDIDGFLVGRVKHKVSDLAECTCVTVY